MVNKASRTRLKKPARKSGFVYKPRKYEDVKRRAEKPAGRYDSYFKQGFDTWRPKVGENVIRILPPTWEDSHEHYGYTIWVHSWVGPDKSTYLCPAKMKKKHCPICDAAEEARKAGEDDEYKHLNVKEQTVFWIIDRDDDDQQPQLYAVSGQMDRDILAQTISSRTGKAIMVDHPDDGYDVFIKRTGQGLKTRYVCSIDRDPSPIEDKQSEQDEILKFIQENPIPSVLKFYNEEYLEKVVEGTMEQKDEDTEDEEDDTEEEDDDDNGDDNGDNEEEEDEEEDDDNGDDNGDNEEEGDEEEDEKPTRPTRSRRGRSEEEEEEEEAPKKTRRKAVEEEDEEDAPRTRRRVARRSRR
jgi:gp32 DNA binding protein like